MEDEQYTDDELGGHPLNDWTPEKLLVATERKLYFIMSHDHGGVYERRARAELDRRQNKRLLQALANKERQERASAPTMNESSNRSFLYDVFLSFGSDDRAPATAIQKELESRGLDVFFSPKSLQGGDYWAEVIRAALVGAFEICLVVSHSSLRREWVISEWAVGWALQKRVTPVLIDCSANDLPERLRALQHISMEKVSEFAEEALSRSKVRVAPDDIKK